MSLGATINPKLVREAITTNLQDEDIEGAISDALDLYDSVLGEHAITVRVQIKIKKYLAAHFVSLKDPTTRIDKEQIGDAAVTYTKIGHSDTYTGLRSTRWGQQAIMFDPTRLLLGLNSAEPRLYAL